MNTLGETTKTTFLKGVEAHKLHEEFEVEGLSHTLTFDAALVASNTINGYVGGNAISQVTYATSSDNTMALIATAISAMEGVKSATVTDNGSNDRVIVVIPEDQATGLALTGFAVTNGASQAAITVATVNKKVYAGMPVEINATSGKVQPLNAATASTTYVGIAVQDGAHGDLVTVALNGKCIINAKSADALAYGPVAYSSYDATNGFVKVTDTSVTETNIIGWTLDSTTGADESVRVIMK